MLAILARSEDEDFRAALERQLGAGGPRVASVKGTILLVTRGFAERPVQSQMAKALEAWAEGKLLIVAVDGAPSPLGLRDVSRIEWTIDGVLPHARILEQLAEPSRAAELLEHGLELIINGWTLAAAGVVLLAFLGPPAVVQRVLDILKQLNANVVGTPIGEIFHESLPSSGSPLGVVLIVAALIAMAALASIILMFRVLMAILAKRRARRTNSPDSADDKWVFVSYSRKDTSRVDPVGVEIETIGFRVWIDRRNITGSAGWAGQIVRALKSARTVALMASPNSYASDQVVREIYLAMEEKKPIIPFELEAADMPDELRYILAPFQRHAPEGADLPVVVRNAFTPT